jgi:hypothetical protein
MHVECATQMTELMGDLYFTSSAKFAQVTKVFMKPMSVIRAMFDGILVFRHPHDSRPSSLFTHRIILAQNEIPRTAMQPHDAKNKEPRLA